MISAFIGGAFIGGALGWIIWLIWVMISRWEESFAIRMAAVLAGALIWAALALWANDMGYSGDRDNPLMSASVGAFGGALLGWLAIRQWEKSRINTFAIWVGTVLVGALIGAILLGWLGYMGDKWDAVLGGAWWGALIGGGLVALVWSR